MPKRERGAAAADGADGGGGGGADGAAAAPARPAPYAPDECRARFAELGAEVFLEKVLTASDTQHSGRIVVPKAVAEGGRLPRLADAAGEVLALRDARAGGPPHECRFRFWTNAASRMYLLENTLEAQRRYGMRVGDVLVFGRTPDGRFVVAGRRGTKDDVARRAPARAGGAPKPKPAKPKPKPAKAGPGEGGGGGGGGDGAAAAAEPRAKRARAPSADAATPAASPPDAPPPPPKTKRARVASASPPGAGGAAHAAAPDGRATKPGGSGGGSGGGGGGAARGGPYHYWPAAPAAGRRDGVFRALPPAARGDAAGAANTVAPLQGGWAAVVSLGGELFEATFETEGAAVAALQAARQGEAAGGGGAPGVKAEPAPALAEGLGGSGGAAVPAP